MSRAESLLESFQDNDMTHLDHVPAHLKDRMERRRNTTSWVEQAILKGKTLPELHYLVPGLDEMLKDPSSTRKIIKGVLERMSNNQRSLVPASSATPEHFSEFTHLAKAGFLKRSDLTSLRLTSKIHKESISTRNPSESPPSLKQLVKFIKEQRDATKRQNLQPHNPPPTPLPR